jgi:hypothetical protein
MLSKLGVKVMDASPEGVLKAALDVNPFNIKNRIMLRNLRKNNIGDNERSLLTNMLASVGIDAKGNASVLESTNGFAATTSALSGNKNAKNLIASKVPNLFRIIDEAFASDSNKTRLHYKNYASDIEPANPNQVAFMHSTKYGVERDQYGNVNVFPAGHFDNKYARSTLHGTPEEPVSFQPKHMDGDWSGEETLIVSSLGRVMEVNGKPLNMNPLDTYFSVPPGKSVVFPEASILRGIGDPGDHASRLIKNGVIQKGQTPPIFVDDMANKEIVYARKEVYTDKDREEILRILEQTQKNDRLRFADAKLTLTTKNGFAKEPGSSDAYTELETLQRLALLLSRRQQGLSPSRNSDDSIKALAQKLNIEIGTHSGSPEGVLELFGAGGRGNRVNQRNINTLLYNVFRGFFKTEVKDPPDIDRLANGGLVGRYAMGGMVKAAGGGLMINGQIVGGYNMGGMVQKFVNGGYAMGTDTVPAMLTPGEFVIKKSAVDRIGPSALNKINGYAEGGLVGGMSAVAGDSVYNNNAYEINVNVRSDANPDQIARAVMTQIRQIDNHRIRGV